MKHLKRIGLTAALLVTLVAGLGSAPASASKLPGMPTCSATNLVGHYTAGGGGLAELDLYWDAAHRTNCVKMAHLGAAYGHAAHTNVQIFTCTTNTAGQTCYVLSENPPYYGSDDGNYEYYAGLASVTGSAHCIYAAGFLDWGGRTYKIETSSTGAGTHCG